MRDDKLWERVWCQTRSQCLASTYWISRGWESGEKHRKKKMKKKHESANDLLKGKSHGITVGRRSRRYNIEESNKGEPHLHL